jgi:hypothetical protein
MTITVDVIDSSAFHFLRDMERSQLIRLREPYTDQIKTRYQQIQEANSPQRLSERFAGALRLSDEQYQEFQETIKRGRSEWERDIY